MGDGADPAGWIAKAMAVLKAVNASPASNDSQQRRAQPWREAE
ncbi:MAG: hypothetical protein FD148_2118 [Methylocystaceae bacterium]|nr:MAG: hypothetical protein FD148_2118 [Methylocystaceae bacterium]